MCFLNCLLLLESWELLELTSVGLGNRSLPVRCTIRSSFIIILLCQTLSFVLIVCCAPVQRWAEITLRWSAQLNRCGTNMSPHSIVATFLEFLWRAVEQVLRVFAAAMMHFEVPKDCILWVNIASLIVKISHNLQLFLSSYYHSRVLNIVTLDNRWRWMVSITPRPFYLRKWSFWFPLYRRPQLPQLVIYNRL